jgi:hypothetical protein
MREDNTFQQSSRSEYVKVKLKGVDAPSLTVGDIMIAITAPGAVVSWVPATSYDPATSTAKLLVGSETSFGMLPLGELAVRARIADTPEDIDTDPYPIYVY